MIETRFTYSIMRKWEQQDKKLWWTKLPDSPLASRTGKRTIDVLACWKRNFIAMEWKLRKNERSFPINRVSEQQIRTLQIIQQAGGISLIVIGTYLGPRNKHLHIFTVHSWLIAVDKAKENGQKSIKLSLSHDRQRGCFYCTAKNGIWNIGQLQSAINSLINIERIIE